MSCKKCCEHTSERRTERDDSYKRKLLNRLSRIEGQIRGLKGMIEKDAYCADILTQSAAAGAALGAFNRDLLSRHIKTCVADDLRGGRDEAADELAELVRKLSK